MCRPADEPFAQTLGAPGTLRVLTFNCGLLRWRVLGYTAFASPPFVPERFEAIVCSLPKLLESRLVDVCALQEVYEAEHVERLVRAMSPYMPYHARVDNHRVLQFHNGLLIFSRHPIDDVSLRKHARSSMLERLFGCKSCLTIRVSLPSGRSLSLTNLHTTAGGGADPESTAVDDVRESELLEVMEVCEHTQAAGHESVIIGDLNAGPDCSAANYHLLARHGYTDAAADVKPPLGPTWCASSKLNNLTVFAKCPDKRIDHLFLHPQASLVPCHAETVFTEPVVRVPAPEPDTAQLSLVPLSDHYGVLFELDMR